MPPKNSIFRKLWQYIKKLIKTLLRVTEFPRRLFAFTYNNLFRPLLATARAIMTPFYNYFIAVVSTVLPASVNPFKDYVLNNEKLNVFTRFGHAGQHAQWAFKKHIYTSKPHLIRKTFHEQLAADPDYFDEMEAWDRHGVLTELGRQDREENEMYDRLGEQYNDISPFFPDLMPDRVSEAYRQSIGQKTWFGWFLAKVFFWWADILKNLEGWLAVPTHYFIYFMRNFGFQPSSLDFFRKLNGEDPQKLSRYLKNMTPYKLKLLGTINPELSENDKELYEAEVHRVEFEQGEYNRLTWYPYLFGLWNIWWKRIKELPYYLGGALDASANLFMTPFAYLFTFVDIVVGDPLRVMARFLTLNWYKHIYFPFMENVFEPILLKRVWKPIFSQLYGQVVDPLIGEWIDRSLLFFFQMLHLLMNDPLVFLFSAIYQITRLPGDLLYIVYLFMVELEQTVYFYFLYPMTRQAIVNNGFGLEVWRRIQNLWSAFIRIVGYSKPSAVFSMSVIFTSLLVFFLNLVPL